MLWLPLLVWSIISFMVWAILRLFNNKEALLQYHLRVVLLGAIPAGLAVMLAIDLFQTESRALAAYIQSALISIPNPGAHKITTGILEAESWPLKNLKILLGLATILLGFVSLLKICRLLQSYNQLRQFVQQTRTYFLEELTEQNANRSLTDRKITVGFSPLISTPFTYTLGKPVIIMPESVRGSIKEMQAIIQHEIIHIQRSDFLLNMLSEVVKAVFWFHPLVQLYAREAEIYREVSCDAGVLSDKNLSITRKEYAQLLYQMTSACNSNALPAVSISLRHSLLKKRIKFMENKTSNSRFTMNKSALISLIFLIAMAGLVGCTKLENPVTDSEALSTINSDRINLHVESAGLLEVDGKETTLQEFYQLLKDIPQRQLDKLVVYFSVHPDAPYGSVTDIEKIMRKRGTLRINYSSANGKK